MFLQSFFPHVTSWFCSLSLRLGTDILIYPGAMPETRGTDWTDAEVRAAVDSYFDMLRKELRGESFNKAAENRRLQGVIGRTRTAIEFKHQNISAVLIEAKAIPIDGYKPMRNAQGKLRSIVLERYNEDEPLRRLMLESVEDSARTPTRLVARPDLLIPSDPPSIDLAALRPHEKHLGRFVDYQRLEAQRRDLGLAGELAVMAYERTSLEAMGLSKLANRVEHIAQTRGDGLGYDVLSFEPNGKEKFIEVKTTKSIKQLPFFVTRNEVEFSTEAGNHFHLYRLFHFGKPKNGFYSLRGPLTQVARLDPVVFEGRPAEVQ